MTVLAKKMPKSSNQKTSSGRSGVFKITSLIVIVFILLVALFPQPVESLLNLIQSRVIGTFGWYYILLLIVLLVFALIICFGKYGNITLGKDQEPAKYSLPVWFSMVFACAMGIGLMFWGPAEPLSHYLSPRPGISGTSEDLANEAMIQSYFHWGFNAWAMYAVVGLALAYAFHRRNRPVSIRWSLEPVFGDRVTGKIGDAIDIIAVIGTIFGIATTLGLGALQIDAGLAHLGVTSGSSVGWQIGIIAAVTIAATLSVVSGLDRGIKWLSNINLGLAGVLLLAVLIAGPTLFLLRNQVQSFGHYIASLVDLSFHTSAFQGEEGQNWQASWTVFYWGWWMSWAPFVGVFIARISRGRTVREFVVGTLVAPTIVSCLWFGVFGGSAIERQRTGDDPIVKAGEDLDVNTVMFELLEGLPLPIMWIVLALVLIAIFFVTSADSGSLVIDMLTSNGDSNPPIWSRVFWAFSIGSVGIVLLLAGGLSALRTMAIIIALPFSFVIIGMMLSLIKAFRTESQVQERIDEAKQRTELTGYLVEAAASDDEMMAEMLLEESPSLYERDVEVLSALVHVEDDIEETQAIVSAVLEEEKEIHSQPATDEVTEETGFEPSATSN